MYTATDYNVDELFGVEALDDIREDRRAEWTHCTNFLSDQSLSRKLQGLRFDMGFLDAFPHTRCFAILFYRWVGWAAACPSSHQMCQRRFIPSVIVICHF